jgi:ketosteroid isomerase-like protein
MTEIDPLPRMLIVQACTDLIHRFAERNDARDADALADMFVEDGVFARPTMPDKPMRGRETIRAQFHARPPGKMTRHICVNTVVTVSSASEASACSYMLLCTADFPEGATLPVKADTKQLLGAFDDKFALDSDGTWKFKHRQGSLAMTIGG